MLRIIDLTKSYLDDYSNVVPRGEMNVEQAMEIVRPICADVAKLGATALAQYSQQFDHVVPDSFRVPYELIRKAEKSLPNNLRESFSEAISRRRKVCQETEVLPDQRSVELEPGAVVSTKNMAVNRVGLYVPAGLAPLASSVLMNVVPAQEAGVKEIAVASPPSLEHGGYPHPTILAVCAMLGVDEVYAVGGAQAIAMFAYGVDDVCKKVDLVTGPGNIFVVGAKRLLRSQVGIDSEAGPTEIAVLADEKANPAFIAADLISQAEHDPMAGSVLVTDSAKLIEQVNAQINQQVVGLKHAERMTTALSGKQSGAVLVRDLEQAIEVVNDYAAEHLEIQTQDAAKVAQKIRNAGAIFVGPYSPVPLGDYTAGSTHVLPTSATAKYSSGLTCHSFYRTVHVVEYSATAFEKVSQIVENFGLAEDLPAHAHAATIRTIK